MSHSAIQFPYYFWRELHLRRIFNVLYYVLCIFQELEHLDIGCHIFKLEHADLHVVPALFAKHGIIFAIVCNSNPLFCLFCMLHVWLKPVIFWDLKTVVFRAICKMLEYKAENVLTDSICHINFGHLQHFRRKECWLLCVTMTWVNEIQRTIPTHQYND